MEKILAKLPELQRNAIQNILNIINNANTDYQRDIFISRLKGQADILFASKFIDIEEYIFMTGMK